jgi:hypothetical protein
MFFSFDLIFKMKERRMIIKRYFFLLVGVCIFLGEHSATIISYSAVALPLDTMSEPYRVCTLVKLGYDTNKITLDFFEAYELAGMRASEFPFWIIYDIEMAKSENTWILRPHKRISSVPHKKLKSNNLLMAYRSSSEDSWGIAPLESIMRLIARVSNPENAKEPKFWEPALLNFWHQKEHCPRFLHNRLSLPKDIIAHINSYYTSHRFKSPLTPDQLKRYSEKIQEAQNILKPGFKARCKVLFYGIFCCLWRCIL